MPVSSAIGMPVVMSGVYRRFHRGASHELDVLQQRLYVVDR